jgi:hypothetical protein
MQDLVSARLSDGFSAFARSETFDVILANLPGRSETAADFVVATQWDTGLRLHTTLWHSASDRIRGISSTYAPLRPRA